MLPHIIDLQNSSNLRDLGGWPTADGRVVRRGLVFRAPALVGLSAADEAAVAALGLRTVCDLRGVRESAASPVMVAGAKMVPLPIEPSVGAGLRDILKTGEATGHITAEELLGLLSEAYRAYALQSFSQYRALFERLLAADGLPLLLHCSAGKDRTGFGSALLLTALGVEWKDVAADYLATNRFWRRETARNISELPAALADVLLGAHESLLEAAFAAVREAYGGVNAYLEQAIGLDEAALARLRERLLA